MRCCPAILAIIVRAGTQEALRQQDERRRRGPTQNQAVITDADRARVKRLKVAQFISGMSCRRIHFDYELDDRSDRARCEEGEEVCDVCSEDDRKATNTEALRRAYNAEQQKVSQQGQERMWDSGVEIPSSFPVVSMASSPPPRHPVPSSPIAICTVVPSSARSVTPTERVFIPTSSQVSIDKDIGSSPSKYSAASTASFDCGFSTESAPLIDLSMRVSNVSTKQARHKHGPISEARVKMCTS